MKTKWLFSSSVFILFFSTTGIAQTIFIKAVGSTGAGSTVGTFDGGSTDATHKNEIEATAYADGLTGCIPTGGKPGGCKVLKTPFAFSMSVNHALISFKFNMLTGRIIKTVDMVIRKSGGDKAGDEFYKVHMEDVVVTEISEGGASGESSPQVNIEIIPQKIAWEVTKTGGDGKLFKMSTGWDFAANKAYSYGFPVSK